MTLKPFTSQSERQQGQTIELVRKQRAEEHVADLRRLMASEWGRRIVYRLFFEDGNIFGRTFAGHIKDGSAAGQHAAFADGRRDFALDVIQRIQEVAPRDYHLMQSERLARSVSDLALDATLETDQQGARQS